MKTLWRRFKDANQRLTNKCARSFGCPLNAYHGHAFAWMWHLVPIAGQVGFYGIGWEWDLKRWEASLKRREAAEAKSVSPPETTARQMEEEGTASQIAIQQYNSWQDDKDAYIGREHPEWMDQQYGPKCEKCGFRHFPRSECPVIQEKLDPPP